MGNELLKYPGLSIAVIVYTATPIHWNRHKYADCQSAMLWHVWNKIISHENTRHLYSCFPDGKWSSLTYTIYSLHLNISYSIILYMYEYTAIYIIELSLWKTYKIAANASDSFAISDY